MMNLSIVIPMYNEEKRAADTARSLEGFFSEKFPDGDFEIIFSNDGSTDGCAKAVSGLSLPHVKVIGYPDNRGKGSAVREGILAASGKYVAYTDCDLAYGIEAIYNIYSQASSHNCQVLIGSRNISADGYDGYTFVRKLMSKAYIKFISLFAGFNYTDSQCGLKCLRTDLAHQIFEKCRINGFAFDLEMLLLADKHGFAVTEFPVKIINHNEADSKVNAVKDAFKMIKDISHIKKIHK